MYSMTQTDSSDLKRLEGIVKRGQQAFIEVGTALKEIRDRRLYKASHGTFSAYVEEKFGFKRHYAYNLIDASEAVKNVEHAQQITNPRQAVELAKAPPEKRDEVIEHAVKNAKDGKPTAKDFAKAREQVVQSQLVEDDEDDWEDIEDEEDTFSPVAVGQFVDLFINASNRMQLLRSVFDQLEDHEVAILSSWMSDT